MKFNISLNFSCSGAVSAADSKQGDFYSGLSEALKPVGENPSLALEKA